MHHILKKTTHIIPCSLIVLVYWTIFEENIVTKILHQDILLYVSFCCSGLIMKVFLEFISVPFFSVILYFYAFGLITTSRYCSYAASFTYMT